MEGFDWSFCFCSLTLLTLLHHRKRILWERLLFLGNFITLYNFIIYCFIFWLRNRLVMNLFFLVVLMLMALLNWGYLLVIFIILLIIMLIWVLRILLVIIVLLILIILVLIFLICGLFRMVIVLIVLRIVLVLCFWHLNFSICFLL